MPRFPEATSVLARPRPGATPMGFGIFGWRPKMEAAGIEPASAVAPDERLQA
jgi:hypothetical protein